MIVDNPCNPDPRVLKEATTLVGGGFDVTVIAWDRDAALASEEVISGVKVRRVRVKSGYQRRYAQLIPLLRFWVRAALLIRRCGFDVVHCHDFPTLPLGVLLTVTGRRPLIYDAHEIYWLLERDKYSTIFVAMLRRLELLLLSRVRLLITVSEYLARYFRLHHHRVAIVGNWYDPIDLSRFDRDALRMTMRIPQNGFCLLSAGALDPIRLQGLLIEYAKVHPETTVIVAGRGVLEGQFAEAGLRNLHFLGWKSDLSPFFAVADALFYGLAAEQPYSQISSPNALFLSIAMEIPLITTFTGEAGAVVRGHDAGEILATASVANLHQCIRNLSRPERLVAVRMRLRDLQRTYSWDRAATSLLEAYAG